MKKNATYLIFGFIIAIMLFLFISTSTNSQDNGRYQITGDTYPTILDTKTGVAKAFLSQSKTIEIIDFQNETYKKIKWNTDK